MLTLPRNSLLAALWSFTLVVAQNPSIVDLGYAQYQGTVDTATNITILLGVRYAAPPIGDLRFRAPQSPAFTPGVEIANVQPNECMQAAKGISPTNPLERRATEVVPSEDCLFLNVYYPSDATGTPMKNLPTLVWFHAGGYVSGGASTSNGEDIIRQSNHNIVVVRIQYRLGIFGFLAGAAVREDGTLNAGLRDQEFAMRWVQKHITKFGGDPAKVTIWGQSAGAGSVFQHIVANGGKTQPQLFRGAITSSTFVPSQYAFDDPISEFIFNQVVAQTNCTSVVNAMACLRAADPTVLETANTNIVADGFFGTFTTAPVIDGEFITQPPTLSFLQGKVNGQVLLSITNAFEGTLFVNQSVVATAAEQALDLFPNFTASQADEVSALYAGLGTDLFQVNGVMGESIFICPTYSLLHAFAGRAFKGEFAVPPAFHGSDFAYYYPGNSTPPVNNMAFINAFAQTFTSFIINLDPNIKVSDTIIPRWDKYNVGNTEMLFNMTEAGRPDVRSFNTDEAFLRRCQFWNSVGNLTGH
ncbi:Alpha/Beta hydrolase protein [Roridomyces roridus]|uniref:Carboxylic ester hydrolase n=1 Tax=Roridomyces roridus TaxID=1738132 RepID=A0AAD7FKB1_9AGAR|nr:Alpha/Beta hydrolase protein [Roridomyces roridus]